MSQNSDPQNRKSSNSGETEDYNANQNESPNNGDAGKPAKNPDFDEESADFSRDSQSPELTEADHIDLPQQHHEDDITGPCLIARYGRMRLIGEFRYNLERKPVAGTKVVLRTERGVEMGQVLTRICEDSEIPDNDETRPDTDCKGCVKYGQISRSRLDEFIKKTAPSQPLAKGGKILRVANTQDLIDQRHLESASLEKKKRCVELIKEMSLEMQIVFVEHLLGGERIIFYFLAEQRVDFRELVRQLASEYRTRIEMRQVGARDEARLIADYERCGQRCCCQQYLKDLKPVSMRMAKTQKATLDPTKISGRCGRLMCCLRYEDKTYQQLKAMLPHRNVWVRTEALVGRVIDSQILTQLVNIQLPDQTYATVANEEIIERNIPEPTPEQAAKMMAPPVFDVSIAPSAASSRRISSQPREDIFEDEFADTSGQREPDRQDKSALDEVQLDPGWKNLFGSDILADSDNTQADDEYGRSDPLKTNPDAPMPQEPAPKPSTGNDENTEDHPKKPRRKRPRRKRRKNKPS